MKIILINIVTLCCLLASQLLFASVDAEEFVMTPRARKIFEEAPKTPEELLLLVKSLMDNPDRDGYEFVEKISGINRDYWELSNRGEGFGPKYRRLNVKWSRYSFLTKNSPTYQKLYLSDLYPVISEGHLLLELGLGLSKNGFEKGLSLTPEKLKAALGNPNRIKLPQPWWEFVKPYAVYYYYYTTKYEFAFIFYSKNKTLLALKNKNEVSYLDSLGSYEIHKVLPAVSITMLRTKK